MTWLRNEEEEFSKYVNNEKLMKEGPEGCPFNVVHGSGVTENFGPPPLQPKFCVFFSKSLDLDLDSPSPGSWEF